MDNPGQGPALWAPKRRLGVALEATRGTDGGGMFMISRLSPNDLGSVPFAITESPAPNSIRVYAGDPHDDDMVCVIGNLSQLPVVSWGPQWTDKDPAWKTRLADTAVHSYHRALRRSGRRTTAEVDDR